VLDSFQLLGPNTIPATVSFRIRWEATGPAQSLDLRQDGGSYGSSGAPSSVCARESGGNHFGSRARFRIQV
jgi:hypothetical protein